MSQTVGQPSYLDSYKPQCKVFEGCIAWMYLDSVGKVTVGVGNMLPDVDAALRLPFRVQSSGDLAGESAVRRDYARVSAMAPNRMPAFYHEYESLILNDADIDALLMARLQGFDVDLRRVFPSFESFPPTAKLGSVDMIYNLGPERLVREYPHFLAAARSGNFNLAAAECERNKNLKAFEQRNAWTRQQFLTAALVAA